MGRVKHIWTRNSSVILFKYWQIRGAILDSDYWTGSFTIFTILILIHPGLFVCLFVLPTYLVPFHLSTLQFQNLAFYINYFSSTFHMSSS